MLVAYARSSWICALEALAFTRAVTRMFWKPGRTLSDRWRKPWRSTSPAIVYSRDSPLMPSRGGGRVAERDGQALRQRGQHGLDPVGRGVRPQEHRRLVSLEHVLQLPARVLLPGPEEGLDRRVPPGPAVPPTRRAEPEVREIRPPLDCLDRSHQLIHVHTVLHVCCRLGLRHSPAHVGGTICHARERDARKRQDDQTAAGMGRAFTPKPLTPPEIARKLRLDEKTVRLRVRRMEESGFIKYYQATPELAAFGLRCLALYRFEAMNVATKISAIQHARGLPGVLQAFDYLGPP